MKEHEQASEQINPQRSRHRSPDAKPDGKDDLKSLPMPEVEKKLGSSPEGLSQAEAAEAADSIRAKRD